MGPHSYIENICKFLLFFLPLILCAASVGNTSAPEILQKGFFTSCNSLFDIRAGYEGDFVSDGRMKQYDEGNGRVDQYKQWTNSATLTFNAFERVDTYAVFGSSKTKADWRFENRSDDTNHRIEIETQYNFLWAVGGRIVLYNWSNTSFGVGGRYSSCHYQPTDCISDGIPISKAGSHFNWGEWQCNFDISYKISLFTPYIGTKYSNAKTQLSDFSRPISNSLTRSNSFKNRVSLGLYIGCTLSTGRYFMFNIEGRLVDEEAITVSGEFRF